MRVYAFEFQWKISAQVNWNKRQDFEKWDRVLVWADEKIRLLRLWAKSIWEKDIVYDDLFTEEDKENIKTTKPKENIKTTKPKDSKKDTPAVEGKTETE